MNKWKKGALAIATCATLAISAAPAEAQRYGYRGYRHHNNGAGAAIAGGIVGLALGAAIASSSRDRYYDRGYRGYNRGGYYRDDYYDRGYYRDNYRPYRGGYRGYRSCSTDRYYDDYAGEWTTIQRCR